MAPRTMLSSLALLLVALASGCCSSTPDAAVEDAPAAIGEAILDGKEGDLLFVPGLRVRDEAVLADILAKQRDLPARSRKMKRFVRKVGSRYRRHFYDTESGRAALAAAVEARYAAPLETKAPDGSVTWDLGLLPGKLVVRPRERFVEPGPGLVEHGHWSASALLERLRSGMKRHPDAPALHLVVRFRAPGGRQTWTYTHDRKAGELRIELPEAVDSNHGRFLVALPGGLPASLSLPLDSVPRDGKPHGAIRYASGRTERSLDFDRAMKAKQDPSVR